ncbi:MAG TPA: hypothetical protein VFV54_01450 [Thermoanaerobaculia bacterium]|nr:hypothetical protein [Thermoanaerobaculia bacterium]
MLGLISSLLLLALVAFPCAAAVNPRDSLAMLEGEWTIEGKEAWFRESCAWYEGRSHMVCTSESRRASGVRRGVSVMSYSENAKRLVYYHYGSSGAVVALDLFVEGGVLTATGERAEGADLVRSQVSMTPRADGSFDFREEESRNGGPWTTTASIRYVRIAGAPKGE